MNRVKRSVFLLLLMMGLLSSQAYSADMLSQSTYKRLEEIHQLISQEKYNDALTKLDELKQRIRNTKLEHASLWQSYGYVYASMNKYKKAIDAFKRCLEYGALPEVAQNNMLFNVAQLYLVIEDSKNAQMSIEKWLKLQKQVSVAGHELAGIIYAQNQNYKNVIKHMNAAIDKSKNPKESWFQILLSAYYDQKNYAVAAQTLERMVVYFPNKKEYWKQLSGVYYTLKEDKKSLAVLEMAYQKSLLDKPPELINLAKLYLMMNIPYKASEVIEDAMQKKIVARDVKHLKMLSECYMQAKEFKKAILALQQAAQINHDAELYYRIAQLQAEEGLWKETITALEQVLKQPNYDKIGDASLLKGVAHYELKQWQEAKQAFSLASTNNSDGQTKQRAEQWLQAVSQVSVE